MSRVDLIVPTYNGGDLLRACLLSLRQSSFQDFRLFVFDDASSEPISAITHSVFPLAEIVRSETNLGLARGFNLAIERGSAEYVVLLNNDTDVEPEWLGELVAAADRHPDAGSIASKLRLMSDRSRIHSAGDYFSVRGMPGNRGAWQEDVGQFDREEPVFSACGGAALYRRSALDAVRLDNGQIFDERLFMYCEDVDLGWRLQRSGWPCVFAPRAVVYHALSATGGGTLASYFVARNIWLVLSRSVPPGVLTPYRSRIAAFHVGRVFRALRHLREPAARATLRGTVAGLALALAKRDRPTESTIENIRHLRQLLWTSSPASMPGT
jgi:GT2 family glycosyltransferase